MVNVEQVRAKLKTAFPEALIADFRQAHPAIERGLEEATTFLSLVSLDQPDRRAPSAWARRFARTWTSGSTPSRS